MNPPVHYEKVLSWCLLQSYLHNLVNPGKLQFDCITAAEVGIPNDKLTLDKRNDVFEVSILNPSKSVQQLLKIHRFVCAAFIICPSGYSGTEYRKKNIMDTLNTYTFYHFSLRCQVGNWQFVGLTHFIRVILCYWRAVFLSYKAPLQSKCLLSILHFRWWYWKFIPSSLSTCKRDDKDGGSQDKDPPQSHWCASPVFPREAIMLAKAECVSHYLNETIVICP